MTPAVSVVVVTYSPGTMLAGLLESLPAATTVPPDVVLADNGSTDGAPERAVDAYPNVTLLSTGANLGYGTAANVGVAACAGDFVLVVNPDVELAPRAIDELVAAFGRWPQAGAVGPLIYTTDGRVYPSARALPSLFRGTGHALFGWWWPDNPWTRAYRLEDGRPEERPVGWLSGSCLMVRRSAFESVGGFDESYFMYFEDTDLGRRLGRGGWQSVYVPSAAVTHHGGHSTNRDPVPMMVEHHRSAYRYLSSEYSGWRWLPIRFAIKVGLWARAAAGRRVAAVAAGAQPSRRASREGNDT